MELRLKGPEYLVMSQFEIVDCFRGLYGPRLAD